jgi:hypothetical protein
MATIELQASPADASFAGLAETGERPKSRSATLTGLSINVRFSIESHADQKKATETNAALSALS